MLSSRELANAIRALSMDAVEKAKSGHPGAPLGMADMAERLWRGFLKHNPLDPLWANRDRFVLSNGHASMLLYSLLHLSGYDLTIEDIKNFRQLGSKTAGHPEYGHTPGVETTTGPLGQGLANAVGMALAERALAAEFNRPGYDIVDHHTYVFVGDGCLMEGISHEACSLAGTLGLGKLIVLYDANRISIDGQIEGWFNENVAERFRAYGWQVIEAVDGHDAAALDSAIAAAIAEKNLPSLICCQTHIGFGSPNKVDSASSHGSPLGAAEVAATRKALAWPYAAFEIPEAVYAAWDARDKGKAAQAKWQNLFEKYSSQFPDLAKEFNRRLKGELPDDFATISAALVHDLNSQACGGIAENSREATRVASQKILNALAPRLPELFGGSADLTGSVGTLVKGMESFSVQNPKGRYLHYGVREFAMCAIMNGMALHAGFIPYGGTFLIFSDYACNAMRLAALMGLRVIFVLTHDSIGVGEDGPTHQPIEQVPSLRLLPGLDVWRPCDEAETAVAWQAALKRKGPSALVLSRQKLPAVKRSEEELADVKRGAYILRDCAAKPDLIILATGSEVELALQVAEKFTDCHIRVVSMPCAEVFENQSREYRDFVLPPTCRARLAIEAARSDWWRKYVGFDGLIVGLDSFGASAPGDELFKHFGFTAEAVGAAAAKLLKK